MRAREAVVAKGCQRAEIELHGALAGITVQRIGLEHLRALLLGMVHRRPDQLPHQATASVSLAHDKTGD